ncbi:translation initiation factor IF3 subunit 2 [Tubulinosema ratisbonensis]|uniref:Serine-threonine kinase receptor-associated protein n=1 Tax=Tubulinosema ratisbonensis TaxID=291195 RepID=A0A437ALF4_9MICR|nr:translation initiation factor IF3 subunit 2 [Tubulinosema ratisbonensis]
MEVISYITNDTPFLYTLIHHSKPIVDLQFNRDGDLLFTASKAPELFLCNIKGEVINTYKGLNGAITSLTISKDSKMVCTSSADQSYLVHEVESNKVILHNSVSSIPKHVFFSYLQNELVVTCDDSYNQKPCILIPDLRTKEISFKFETEFSPTASLLEISGTKLVFSDVKGNISCVDRRNGNLINKKEVHSTKINKIRPSFCNTFFITASNDTHSKIIDFDLSVKRTFSYDEPLNDACIFNTNDKIICAGGISARDAALFRGKKTFEVSFYDIVTENLIGSYSPHFGTINAIDVHPSSKIFCSGGEDASISLMKFDNDFYEAEYTELDD